MRSQLDTPPANRLSADDDSSFSQQILDIAVAKIESVVRADRMVNIARAGYYPMIEQPGQTVAIW